MNSSLKDISNSMNPASFPIETPERFSDQSGSHNFSDLPLPKESFQTTKIKGKGRPKKLETVLKDLEKTYKNQLTWLERKDDIPKARERLAELIYLKSKKRKDEIKILEAQIEEACQWEKVFAATKEAGGSLANLLEKMDRVKFKTEGMVQALEYKRDWDMWFAAASCLDKKCNKKKKDMTESEGIEQEFDMIKSLRKILKEEKHLKYKEDDKGLHSRLKEKLQNLKFIQKAAVPEVPTKLFNSQIFDFYKNFETLLNMDQTTTDEKVVKEGVDKTHLGQKLASNCLDYNIEHLAIMAQLSGSVEAFSKEIPEMTDLQIIYDKLTLVLRIHSTIFQDIPQVEDPFAYAKEINIKSPQILQQESLKYLASHSLSDVQQKAIQELCQNPDIKQKSLSFKNNLDQNLLDYFQEVLKLTTSSQNLKKPTEIQKSSAEIKIEEEKANLKSSDNKVAKQAYRVIELFFQKTLPDICEKYDQGIDYEKNCKKIEELCNKYLRLEEELAGKQDKDKELQHVRKMIEKILGCFKWLTKLFKKQNNNIEKWTYEELTHAAKIISECKIPYTSKVVGEINRYKMELEILRKEYQERYEKKRAHYFEAKQDQLTIEEAKSTLTFINNAPGYLYLEQEKKQIEQDIQVFIGWKNDLQKLTNDSFPPKSDDFCSTEDHTFEERFIEMKKNMTNMTLRSKKGDKLYKPLSWLYEVSVLLKSQKGNEEEIKLKALYNAGEKLAEIRPDLGILTLLIQIKDVLDIVEQVAILYSQIKELKRDFERKRKVKWSDLEIVMGSVENKKWMELPGSKYLNQIFNTTRNLKDRTEQLLSEQEITIKEVKSVQEALKKDIVSLEKEEERLNALLKQSDDLLKFCRNKVAMSSIEKIDELADRYNKLPIRIEEIEQRLKEFEVFKEKYKNIQKQSQNTINKKMSFEEMDELKSKIHELEEEIPEDKFLEDLKTQIFFKRCKLLKELKDHKFSAGFLRGILLEGKSLKEQNTVVKEGIQYIEERLHTEQKKIIDPTIVPFQRPAAANAIVKYNPLVPQSPPPKTKEKPQENLAQREKYLREIALEIVEKCQNYGVTFKQGLDYANIITGMFPNLLESDVDFPKGIERIRGLLQFPNIAKNLISQKFEANYFKKLIKQNQQELKMLDHKLGDNNKENHQFKLDIPAPQKKIKPNSLQTLPSLNSKGVKSNQILAQSSVKEKITNYNINVLTSFNFYPMDDSSSERKEKGKGGNLLQRITQAKDLENPKYQETKHPRDLKEVRSVISDDEFQIAHDEVFSQDEQEDKNAKPKGSKKDHKKKLSKQPDLKKQQEEDLMRMPENPILYDPDEKQHQRELETIKKQKEKEFVPVKEFWNPRQGGLIENLDEIASLRGDQILKIFDGVLKFEEDSEILPKISLFTCDPFHLVTNIPELTRDGYTVLKVTERLSFKKFEFYLGKMFERSTKRDKQIISGWIESPMIGSQGHGGCFKMAKKLKIGKKIGVCSFHESAKLFVMHRKQMTSEWKHKLNFTAKKIQSNAKSDLYFIVIHKPYKIRHPIKSIAPEIALAFDHQPKNIGMEYLDSLALQEKSDKESSITLDQDLDYQTQTERMIKEKDKISSSQNKKTEQPKIQNLNNLPSLNGKRKLEDLPKTSEENKKIHKESIADPRKRLKIEKMEREAALQNENLEKKTMTNPLVDKISSMGKRTLCKTLKGMNECQIFELSGQIDDKTRGNIISVLKAADTEDQMKIEEEKVEIEKSTVIEEENKENQPSQEIQESKEEKEKKFSPPPQDEKPREIVEETLKPFPEFDQRDNQYEQEQQEFDQIENFDQPPDFIMKFNELFTAEEMMQAREKFNMVQTTSIVKKRPFAIFSSKTTN